MTAQAYEDHEEEGYKGTGLGPADHGEEEHRGDQGTDPQRRGGTSETAEKDADQKEARPDSVPQENLGNA